MLLFYLYCLRNYLDHKMKLDKKILCSYGQVQLLKYDKN
jgi:hypothetical protein